MGKFKKKKVNKKSEDQKKPYRKLESQILKKSEGASNPGGESKEDINEDDVLTLELVKELGGTEDDMKLIDDIEGKDDTEDISKETKSELEKLISSLNFSKYSAESLTVKDVEVENDDVKKENTSKSKDTSIDKKIQDNEISSSSDNLPKPADAANDDDSDEEVAPEGLSTHTFSFLKDKNLKRTHCVVKSGDKWYNSVEEQQEQEGEESNNYWIAKLEKYTKIIMEKDIENYKKASQKGSKKSESAWIQTVLKSGTLNDKFSAYILLLQDSPVHNVSVLETLIDYVNLKSRRPCLMAIENLQQLFLENLLIPTRKLRNFSENPFSKLSEMSGGNKDTIDRYLITWMFEDKLKKLYIKFLDNLELVGKDSIDKTKIKALSTILELLAGNPEQESLLLSRLINKLGDPSRGTAAKAMYLLSQLLERHPVMKWVVVGEVERLLYRPNIATKAQYFGICFLSQILLEKFNHDNLAAKLIKIYFSFFTVSVKKGEVDTKLMKALLTGVNRAFPYASLDPKELDQQMETMHKLVHLVSFNISIQALTLLYQVMDSREAVTDRFYSALYKKILDPELTTSSKQVMFLNLLYKAIKADPSALRVKSFMKRLLQVISYQPSHLVCGLLFLMSEVTKARPEVVITDKVVTDGGANVSKFNDDDSDDEVEHFKDAPEEDDNEDGDESKDKSTNKVVETGWTFKGKQINREIKETYDPTARNPLYSGADKCDYWELQNLSQHFHPSAALFAQNILDKEQIKYTGDPLSDFTLPRFLDRFVFRNPKKNPEKNKPTTVLGKRNIYKPAGIKALAPDSKDFVNRDEVNVPSDEMFIYKYFQEKIQRKGVKTDEDEVASVTSEEFNDFMNDFGSRSKDFDDEDMDFAGGLGEAANDGDNDASDEEDDDLEDTQPNDSESEPEGLEGEDDDNFKDLSSNDEDEDENAEMDIDNDEDEFDEEGFGEDSDEEESLTTLKTSKPKKAKMKFGKFNPNDLSSILADAEEFSHLIEENDDGGTSSSLATKDKASKKQLKWEKNNDDFMKSKKWKNVKKDKFNKKGKPYKKSQKSKK